MHPGRLRSSIPAALCVLGLAWTAGCASSPPPRGELITLLDYFESGRRDVASWLDREKAIRLEHGIERAKRACVRIRATALPRTRTTRLLHGSGVRVGTTGLVLTAGHGLFRESEALLEVTEIDGTVHEGTLEVKVFEPRAESNGDWAVLRIQDPDEDGSPAPGVAFVEKGEIVAVLGYPDALGVSPDGSIAKNAERVGNPLEPIVFVAEVVERSPLSLRPVAGCVPIRGISGGPVVNASGDVVGIIVMIRPATGIWYATDMSPILLQYREELGAKEILR